MKEEESRTLCVSFLMEEVDWVAGDDDVEVEVVGLIEVLHSEEYTNLVAAHGDHEE